MIDVTAHDAVSVVRLDHGPANALDLDLVEALTRTFTSSVVLGADAVVLTGNGKVFCAGVDLLRLLDGGDAYVEEFLPRLATLFETAFRCPVPVVAAVEGAAAAGGCILACAADRRLVASGRGRLGVTELAVGVPFPVAALELLRWCVGTERARTLVLDAELLDARDSVEAGLADRVVDDDELVDAALDEAARLAAIPRPAMALTKAQLRRPTLDRIEAGKAADADVVAAWSSAEVRQAMEDFAARVLKRPAGG